MHPLIPSSTVPLADDSKPARAVHDDMGRLGPWYDPRRPASRAKQVRSTFSLFSLFSLFFPEIISQRDPVFGGNPGPPTVELPAEQRELSLFRRCFSLFSAVLRCSCAKAYCR
jgi:hypothetical protein